MHGYLITICSVLLTSAMAAPRSVCATATVTATKTVSAVTTGQSLQVSTSTHIPVTSESSRQSSPFKTNSNGQVAVSRAGGILDPSAAAQANQVDSSATRAFTGVTIKDSTGKCLTVDATAGDFRENLIPITLETCNGSPGQQWDVLTAGKHDDVAGAALIVSSLTNGCLNFDPRRATDDQVIIFSCGGRADGDGKTTNSQLFPFSGSSTLSLSPENTQGQTCLANQSGKLGATGCNNGQDQLFHIG